MFSNIKRITALTVCFALLLACTGLFNASAYEADSGAFDLNPTLETVEAFGSMDFDEDILDSFSNSPGTQHFDLFAKVFSTNFGVLFRTLDLFLTTPFLFIDDRSFQAIGVEKVLEVLLADKFETVDDVFANLEKQRANNAESKIEEYYAALFNIDVHRYEYTFKDTGVKKAIDVGVINAKPEEEKTDEDVYVFYFHGGAFVDAPLPFHYWFVSRLAEQLDATIIMPMQLMAPEYDYLESYELSLALYEEVIKEVNPEQLTLMGDSSGGNYVISMGLQLRDKGIALPSNIVTFSPWLYMSSQNPDAIAAANSGIDPMIVYWAAVMKGATFAGIDVSGITSKEEAEQLPALIPEDNYYLNPYLADYEGMPPVTIFTGTHEVLVVDTRAFADRIESIYGDEAIVRYADGEAWDGSSDVKIHYYEYEGMNHTFPLFPIPESVQVIEQIYDIVY